MRGRRRRYRRASGRPVGGDVQLARIFPGSDRRQRPSLRPCHPRRGPGDGRVSWRVPDRAPDMARGICGRRLPGVLGPLRVGASGCRSGDRMCGVTSASIEVQGAVVTDRCPGHDRCRRARVALSCSRDGPASACWLVGGRTTLPDPGNARAICIALGVGCDILSTTGQRPRRTGAARSCRRGPCGTRSRMARREQPRHGTVSRLPRGRQQPSWRQRACRNLPGPITRSPRCHFDTHLRLIRANVGGDGDA